MSMASFYISTPKIDLEGKNMLVSIREKQKVFGTAGQIFHRPRWRPVQIHPGFLAKQETVTT